MIDKRLKNEIVRKYKDETLEDSALQTILSSIYLTKITTQVQHKKYLSFLEDLTTKVLPSIEKKSDEKELLAYIQLLASIIEEYETEKYKSEFKKQSPKDILGFLMKENNLKQKDLVDILGSQSVVSEALKGKISVNKAKALGEYFKVSPSLFLNL